jgi:regulatory factor X, other
MAHMHNAAAHSSMDPAAYGGNPAMYHFTQGSNNGMEGMDVAVGHQLAYQQQLQQLQQPQQLQQSQQQSWVDDTDAHLEPMSRGMLDAVTAKMHGMDGQDGNSMAAVVGAPKQTSARSSANNEIEMRQLFHNNRDRTLDDVAREIQSSDHGPNYERSRQLFGMLW